MKESYTIRRFPESHDKTLKAWSAADEYLLKLVIDEDITSSSTITIINDRFGFLTLQLVDHKPNVIAHYKSQEAAILYNLESNGIDTGEVEIINLLDDVADLSDLVLMKVPKSMDLFHLFLLEAHKVSKPNTKIFCGFMTRHFTKQMLEMASLYFENVAQSLAWKKSRIITLSNPKVKVDTIKPVNTISFLNHRGESLKFLQYYGVFSAKRIDFATQFLLENLQVKSTAKRALDLACGNGVMAKEIRMQSPEIEIHLVDDSYLAIASSKLNLVDGDNHFHYNYNLDGFANQYFDLVVCNPPFHFEHENTIDIAIQLFKGVSRILNIDGSFLLVANLHLNYKTHLSKIFKNVEVVNMNSKFEIIRCQS